MKTLKQASAEFIEYLKAEGKAERTLYTYGKDLEQIISFFGEEKIVNKIIPPHVARFKKSDILLKKRNKEGELTKRAKPTIDKTLRVLKMMMEWDRESENSI